MEELQLALTAARVEQRNFGLWLKSWQVGQVLQALVADKLPSGQLVLRIAGHQITATADIPVQKGAVLNLEVSSLAPIPSLKILSAPASASSGADPLNGQLQLLVPRQGDVAAPYTALLDPVLSAKILSLLGLKSDALEALFRNISRFDQLSDPKQLRRAVQRSGLFLEPQLLLLDQSRGVPFSPDLKADLLRLLKQIDRALGEAGGRAGEAGTKAEGNEPLRAFRERVEGAIATITLHQLATRSADERGGCMWLLHIPFQLGDSAHCLSLSIARDSAGEGEQAGEEEWNVLLNLDLPALGAVEAELFLRRQKLSVVLFSERAETARLLEREGAQLRTALESRGLQVSVLLSHQGSRADRQPVESLGDCVDESV